MPEIKSVERKTKVKGKRAPMVETFSFTKLTDYAQTDSVLSGGADPELMAFSLAGNTSITMESTEQDGHEVTLFMQGRRCLAVWYIAARVGSMCMDFPHDDETYMGLDPFWPYGD